VLGAGAAVIWFFVIGATTVYAIRFRPEAHRERLAQGLILVASIIFPTLLAALSATGVLFVALPALPFADCR
jgi:hypothetical protein